MTSHAAWTTYLGERAATAAADHHHALAAGDQRDPLPDEDWLADYINPADPPGPVAALDPDTVEGAAILRLLRRVKDIEESTGDWNGGEVVNTLTAWFTELGIDPDAHPMDTGRQLRLALREQPGGSLSSAVYGVRIGTEHDNPRSIVLAALRGLAAQLGPGTGIDLVAHDRTVLERIDHPTEPATP